MFKSNITFEGGPTPEQIQQELDGIWAASNHCCYCDPSACSPSLARGTCEECAREYQQ